MTGHNDPPDDAYARGLIIAAHLGRLGPIVDLSNAQLIAGLKAIPLRNEIDEPDWNERTGISVETYWLGRVAMIRHGFYESAIAHRHPGRKKARRLYDDVRALLLARPDSAQYLAYCGDEGSFLSDSPQDSN